MCAGCDVRPVCFHVHGHMGKNNASIKYFRCQDDQREVSGGGEGGGKESHWAICCPHQIIIGRNIS